MLDCGLPLRSPSLSLGWNGNALICTKSGAIYALCPPLCSSYMLGAQARDDNQRPVSVGFWYLVELNIRPERTIFVSRTANSPDSSNVDSRFGLMSLFFDNTSGILSTFIEKKKYHPCICGKFSQVSSRVRQTRTTAMPGA